MTPPTTRTRRRRPPWLILGGCLTAACIVMSGCSSGSSASGTTITLYSAQHEQTTAAMAAAFTQQTGFKVRVKSGDESALTAEIVQEGSRSPADVFYTENSPWLAQLDQKGLLATLDASTMASMPGQYSSTDNSWVGVSARVSQIMYNTDKVSASDLPTSIMDLADPKWKGKLELAPGETDFWPIVSNISRTYGQARAVQWLEAVKTNAGSDIAADNETMATDISKGNASIGILNHYYYYRLQAEVGASSVHAKLASLAPGDPGFLVNVSAAGVLKSSKHQAAAQAFVKFVTSAAGQTLLARGEIFEYPIRAGVAANPVLPPFSGYHPDPVSVASLGAGGDGERLLQQVQLI